MERVVDSLACLGPCLVGDIAAVALDFEAVLETQEAVVQIRHKMAQGYCAVDHNQEMMAFGGTIVVLEMS